MSEGTVSSLVQGYVNTHPSVWLKLAVACGVKQSTARRWMHGHELPNGERFYRLLAFLVQEGHQVEEYAAMSPVVRQLTLLFSTTPAAEITEGLGYASPSHLWVVMRGESGMLPETERRAKRFLAKHGRVVEEEPPSEHPGEPPGSQTGPTGSNHQLAVMLASHLRGALPLAKALADPDVPESCRDNLRELVGFDEFFELTNVLHHIGSRKAREVYQKRGE